MNIFICWSGDRSKRLANALQTYLPQFIPVFQSAPDKNSLFVSDDITKGSRWFDEVERQLDVAGCRPGLHHAGGPAVRLDSLRGWRARPGRQEERDEGARPRRHAGTRICSACSRTS